MFVFTRCSPNGRMIIINLWLSSVLQNNMDFLRIQFAIYPMIIFLRKCSRNDIHCSDVTMVFVSTVHTNCALVTQVFPIVHAPYNCWCARARSYQLSWETEQRNWNKWQVWTVEQQQCWRDLGFWRRLLLWIGSCAGQSVRSVSSKVQTTMESLSGHSPQLSCKMTTSNTNKDRFPCQALKIWTYLDTKKFLPSFQN